MKITRRELECFAQQIARPDFEIRVDDGIKELIGHLERDDYEAVLARAAEIVRERAASSSPIHPKAIRRS